MSELRTILVEQVERLLADQAGPAMLRAVSAGTWPAALWAECEALGLPLALVPEEAGGAGLGWEDAVAVWQVLGRHGAPVPLGDAMLASAALAAAGLEVPEGYAGIAVADAPVPWASQASRLVVADAAGGLAIRHVAEHGGSTGANLAGEPRGAASGAGTAASGTLPNTWGGDGVRLAGALLRASQMAGALEAVLDMTVDYATTRKQFGRAIGAFQAVQQLLAQLAGEVAAAGVAVATAGRAADRHGLAGAAFEIACAKVVAGEAAGLGAAVAHQVHAAIGVTDDHALHLFTRRLWAWRDEYGAERHWARRIGTAALARGGAALWPDLTARDATEETTA